MKIRTLIVIFTLILALYSCGTDNTNNPAVDPPLAPLNLKASGSESEATLSWDSAVGATSYTIYYSDKSDFDKTNALKIENVQSPYTVKQLTNMKLYFFAVAAVNKGGESELSEKVSAMPVAPAAGKWAGKSDTTQPKYVDVKMNLIQTGIMISGTVKLLYYKDKVLTETLDYNCSGTFENSAIHIIFNNTKYMNDYIALISVSTESINGNLTISQLVNGVKETETYTLVMKKVQ